MLRSSSYFLQRCQTFEQHQAQSPVKRLHAQRRVINVCFLAHFWNRHHIQILKFRALGSAHLRQIQRLSELSEVPDSEEDSGGSSGSEPARKRTMHSLNPPYATYRGLPTELKFYPKTWVDILEHAKNQFLVWLITECPWPQRETHLVNAEHSLIEAIDTYRDKGHEIEQGRPWLDCTVSFWFRCQGYYPTYRREMSTLVKFPYT